MIRFLQLLVCVGGMLLLLTAMTVAEIPSTISYQGSLTDAENNPVEDGPQLIRFVIWNHATESAPANDLWNSGFRTVQITGGLFSYELGLDVIFSSNLFSDTTRYLGITVGTDPEISPRTKLTSQAYAFHALSADKADLAKNANNATNADGLGGKAPSHYLDWNNLTDVPAGFADGVDNVGTGDITAVNAGSGLSGGGSSGDVSLSVGTSAITSSHIANNTIMDVDVNNNANISPSKIGGTAATLSGINHFTESNYHEGTGVVKLYDSTMMINANGITIGRADIPISTYLLEMNRAYSTSGVRYGIFSTLANYSDGTLYGSTNNVGSLSGGTGNRYGITSYANNNTVTGSGSRYGIFASAGTSSNASGTSYGVYGIGRGGTYAYGVFGYALSGSIATYAGYFTGNVTVTGTLSQGGGSFKIDHPLDPENKYLQHSFVESPDMMNVYNGNVLLDANGEATITMPDYFNALNSDFRYQLTCIGGFAPVYIADEIQNGGFRIAGGQPGIKISWQVTGIRKDAWAEKNRIEVEVEKPEPEKGYYIHPEAIGFDKTMSINREQFKEAEKHNRDQVEREELR